MYLCNNINYVQLPVRPLFVQTTRTTVDTI